MKTLAPISPNDLEALLASGAPPRVLDVREPNEWVSELGHVKGSELVPLGTLPTQLERFRGEERDIVVVCRSGMRAQKAADLLAAQGLKVRVLTGGMLAWNEAKLPISRDQSI